MITEILVDALHQGKGKLQVIASDQGGWEHVSVTAYRKKRISTWEEMCFVKDLFWDEDEMVVQYHPPRARYVNVHDYVLHLWKSVGVQIPCPPLFMV